MWHFFNDKNKEHKRLFFCLLCFFILCSAFGNLTSLAVDLNNESSDALSRQTDNTDTVSRIYLVHTDVLYKTRMDQKAEILVGNVQLSHKGAILFCDSARFYRADNSFDAYGRVKMVQGDTLKLLSDTLYYKGDDMVAHSIGNVRLYHKESRLETTFLDYFRKENLGVYHDGGTLYDKDNVLCSDWGQ